MVVSFRNFQRAELKTPTGLNSAACKYVQVIGILKKYLYLFLLHPCPRFLPLITNHVFLNTALLFFTENPIIPNF